MKKALSLLLALVLCLSLCACGDSADTPGTTADINNGTTGEVDNGNSENNNVDTSWLVRGETINVAKLRECVEIVELTTENWNELFKVYSYSYTEEKVEKDAFGEVVSTETITHDGQAFGAGNELYHWYDSVVIELKNKATGELSILEFGPYDGDNDKNVDEDSNLLDEFHNLIAEDFNLANYECTRIQGFIYYINVSVGDLPVDTYLWPVFPEGEMEPGALRVIPGTNAIDNDYLKEWLS